MYKNVHYVSRWLYMRITFLALSYFPVNYICVLFTNGATLARTVDIWGAAVVSRETPWQSSSPLRQLYYDSCAKHPVSFQRSSSLMPK